MRHHLDLLSLSAGYSRPPHVPFTFTQVSRRPTVRLNTRRPGVQSGRG